jgi:predicted lipoprotein with Yx(FWY)xxD motif
VTEGDFGAITREDGKRQTTYKGWPLYYYAGDKAPGDVLGQGLGNVWFVANP